MNQPRRYILRRDIVIPAGTVLECIDGEKTEFVSGNFAASFAVNDSRDTSGRVIYGIEPKDVRCMEWFEPITQ